MKYVSDTAALTKEGFELLDQLFDKKLFEIALDSMESEEALAFIVCAFGIIHMDIMIYYAQKKIKKNEV